MPEFLLAPFEGGLALSPVNVGIRLVAAMTLGFVVVFVYRRTRAEEDVAGSFTTTLVLLAILIAMVTQVIGDNVARAFSLVGALSIVRFRTVVRDTQDTAYVIYAVVVGMAAGAGDPWVAGIGVFVVSFAAYLMRSPRKIPVPVEAAEDPEAGTLKVKIGLGHDVNRTLGPLLDRYLSERRLKSMGTEPEGSAIDVTYDVGLLSDDSTEALIKALDQLDGVLSAQIQRRKPKRN
jgi:hypothetical protein